MRFYHGATIKVIVVDNNKKPLDEIQGNVINGNLNIDGASAVRRTCSIGLVLKQDKVFNELWALKSKIKIEIGQLEDDEIKWYNQGYYVITSFASGKDTSGRTTVNISGKDLMCLLNGEVGGIFNAIINFDSIQDNGILKKIPIPEIIREMLHQYGQENFDNIIIRDLDINGKNLLEYRSKTPLYLWRHPDENFENGTIYGDRLRATKVNTKENLPLEEIDESDFESFYNINGVETIPSEFYLKSPNGSSDPYYFTKIHYGDIAGYQETELIYPTELTAQPGETVCSVLDKIKNMLFLFEYFYNEEGQFVFQKKRGDNYNDVVYDFTHQEIVTSLSRSPQINRIKNDITCWVKKRTASGAEIPVSYRLALDKKPLCYMSLTEKNTIYANIEHKEKSLAPEFPGINITPFIIKWVDWREIIYQMMIDYRKMHHDSNYGLVLYLKNPILCQNYKTGYEQYYIDLEKNWRKMYDLSKAGGEEFNDSGWNIAFVKTGQTDFFLDFWEGSKYAQYSVQNIGDRPEVLNEDILAPVLEPNIPDIIFQDTIETLGIQPKHFQYSKFENAFSISSLQKSARQRAYEAIENNAQLVETITLQIMPIYDIKLNHLVYLYDADLNISDLYQISKVSYSLAFNGLMSITAIKANVFTPQTKKEDSL